MTVNGNISVANTSGLLTSTGTWIQGASGNLSSPNLNNVFNNLTIAGSGVTTTLTDDIFTGDGKLTMGPGILNGGAKAITIYRAKVNDALVINNLQMGSALYAFSYFAAANITQNAITLPSNFTNPLYGISFNPYGYNITATGNWNLLNNKFSTSSSSSSPTTYIDMGNYSLTCGDLILGNSVNTNGYIKLGSGNNTTISGNVIKDSGTGVLNKIDFGSSNTSISGNVDFTGITVTPGTSTINLTGTGTTGTIKTAGNALNNLTLNNGLVGYWKMDEGTGTTIIDSSTNSNTGTLTNGPNWSSDTKNPSYYGSDPRSLSFDGIDDLVGLPSISNISYPTIGTWIKTTQAPTDNTQIIQRDDPYGRVWQFRMNSSGFLETIFFNTSQIPGFATSTTTRINDGNWHYIAATWDGTTIKNYIDGVVDGTGSFSGSLSTASAIIQIGSPNTAFPLWTGGPYFSGLLNDVRFYNRALSTTEITALYNGTNPTAGTYTLQDNLDINGNLNIETGKLDVSSSNYNINIAKNFKNVANLDARAGTVTFDSTNQSTISGSSTFNNLIMDTNANGAKTIKFAQNTTQTIAGTWTLNGAIGKVLTLQSTTDTNPWYFSIPAAMTAGDYLDVKDSQNIANANKITAYYNTTNSGNNEPGWLFNNAPTNDSLTFTNPYSGTTNLAVSDDTTEWNFQVKTTNPDGPTDINNVYLNLANSADNSANPTYDSIKLKWTRTANPQFTKEGDTQNAITLTSVNADASSNGNQSTLNFKIKINSNFLAKDTLYAGQIVTTDKATTITNNYSNLFQVANLFLNMSVDQASLSFGSLLPGSIITDTTTTTVSTNYPSGYSLSISDNVASSGSTLLHTDLVTRIGDYLGSILNPTSWSGNGLGFCVYGATNKDTAKWGTGTSATDSSNKYAGVPQNATVITTKTSNPTINDQTKIGYKLVVDNTQKTGNYSGNITFTTTGVLN